MTNAATMLMSDSTLMMTADHQATTTGEPPPTPPPPPIRPRARGMVRPVAVRRAPAVPPPSTPADDLLNDMFELDPVLQNEQNDVIWQRRVDCGRVAGASLLPQQAEQDHRRALRTRRRPSPHPAAAASHGECQQCRRIEETRLQDLSPSRSQSVAPFVDLKPASSHANNEYVDEPSTATDAATTSSTRPLRLSDLPHTDATTTRMKKAAGVPLKSSMKDRMGSSTSLRAAVMHDSGVMCKLCGGCRCASCQRTVLLCSCRACPSNQCPCGLRTVLGGCVPCLCSCWSWTVSSCRRRCTNRPEACRCGVDSL